MGQDKVEVIAESGVTQEEEAYEGDVSSEISSLDLPHVQGTGCTHHAVGFRPAFFFRQRFGRLDWKLIADVPMEQIVAEVDMRSLEKVIDPLTFSDIKPEDLPLFAPQLLSKAISLLQLMVEYLLNYQEGQDELILALREQAKEAKAYIIKLGGEIRVIEGDSVSLKKEVYRYQSFLHICKRLLASKGLDAEEMMDELWLRSCASENGPGWQAPALGPPTDYAGRYPVGVHTCDRCRKAFCSHEYLRRHRKRRHGIDEDEDFGPAPLKAVPEQSDTKGLEERIQLAVEERIRLLMKDFQQSHDNHLKERTEALESRYKEMEAKYKEELEKYKAELMAKDGEINKLTTEKEWLTTRLDEGKKELDELRANLRDALEEVKKHSTESNDQNKKGGLTLVQRLAAGHQKTRLQLEGEKRRKARQLLKAYNCAYRDLKGAWYKWLAQEEKLKPKKKATPPIDNKKRLQELKDRYLTVKENRRSSTVKTEEAGKMNLQDYLKAFERKVDLSVERTFGEVPYYKKGNHYNRAAVEDARVDIMDRLEARASLVGVDLPTQHLTTKQLDRSLMDLTHLRKEEGARGSEALKLKRTLDKMLGTGRLYDDPVEEEEVDVAEPDIDNSQASISSLSDPLQKVLQRYIAAVEDDSIEEVEFPVENVMRWLKEIQEQEAREMGLATVELPYDDGDQSCHSAETPTSDQGQEEPVRVVYQSSRPDPIKTRQVEPYEELKPAAQARQEEYEDQHYKRSISKIIKQASAATAQASQQIAAPPAQPSILLSPPSIGSIERGPAAPMTKASIMAEEPTEVLPIPITVRRPSQPSSKVEQQQTEDASTVVKEKPRAKEEEVIPQPDPVSATALDPSSTSSVSLEENDVGTPSISTNSSLPASPTSTIEEKRMTRSQSTGSTRGEAAPPSAISTPPPKKPGRPSSFSPSPPPPSYPPPEIRKGVEEPAAREQQIRTKVAEAPSTPVRAQHVKPHKPPKTPTPMSPPPAVMESKKERETKPLPKGSNHNEEEAVKVDSDDDDAWPIREGAITSASSVSSLSSLAPPRGEETFSTLPDLDDGSVSSASSRSLTRKMSVEEERAVRMLMTLEDAASGGAGGAAAITEQVQREELVDGGTSVRDPSPDPFKTGPYALPSNQAKEEGESTDFDDDYHDGEEERGAEEQGEEEEEEGLEIIDLP